MKLAPVIYHRANAFDEALHLLSDTPDAMVLAGGQSLMPMLNLRLAAPAHLIDINRLAELDHIREEGDVISMGAMTRQRTIEFSELVAAKLPLLALAIRHVGHRQTRNRGTLGGSLCNLDPAAELALVTCLYDGVMVVDKVGHSRCVTMSDFAIGFMSTALAAGELLSAVRLTPWPSNHGYGFHEFARRKGDWAVVSVGVLMTLDAAGKIDRVAIALGGIASTPLRRPLAEAQLLGATPKLDRLDAAAAMVDDIEVLDDANAPAWYRRQLARVLTRRALVDAARLAGAPL